jgi:hypothetical protein
MQKEASTNQNRCNTTNYKRKKNLHFFDFLQKFIYYFWRNSKYKCQKMILIFKKNIKIFKYVLVQTLKKTIKKELNKNIVISNFWKQKQTNGPKGFYMHYGVKMCCFYLNFSSFYNGFEKKCVLTKIHLKNEVHNNRFGH